MSDFSDEVGDILEEAEEVNDALERDLTEALGVEFSVNMRNVNTDHAHGTMVNFHFEPSADELKQALNDVSDGAYEDVEFQNAGGVHMHLRVSEEHEEDEDHGHRGGQGRSN